MIEMTEEQRATIQRMVDESPVPVSFEQMARWYFGHTQPFFPKEVKG